MAPATSSRKTYHKSVVKRRRRLAPETVLLLRQIFLGTVLLVVLSAVVSGIWYGTRADALQLNQVSVTGGETLSHAVITAKAHEMLQGTYFKLIPRQFAWLYPEQDIRSAIHTIERVKTVELERVGGTELHIRLTEFIPIALWCADKTSNNCLFVDETGYAFTAAPDLSGESLVRYSTLNRAPVRGEYVLPESGLSAVTWFAEAVQDELGWSVVHIEIDSAGDVFYLLPDGSELKLALAANPAEVFANLATILESADFNDLQPGDFQYVDLRFGNKVFVNRESEAATTTDSLAAAKPTVDDVLTAATASLMSTEISAVSADDVELVVPLIEESDAAIGIEPTPETVSMADELTAEDESAVPEDRATSTVSESE